MNKIHPTSLVHADARLGEHIEIGPFCTVGAGVQLGDGCQLISHVVLEGDETVIGENNTFYPFSVIGALPQDMKHDREPTRLVIGAGNTFRESVSIHGGYVDGRATRIGDDNLVMGHVHVAHDCVIGNNNVLVNYVGLSGHVVIGDHVRLSGRVGVVQYLRVGSYTFIGGASVIDRHVPPYSWGYGNRLEIKGINVVGLQRLGFSRESIHDITIAHQIFFRSGLPKAEALHRIEEELGSSEEVRTFLNFWEEVDGKER